MKKLASLLLISTFIIGCSQDNPTAPKKDIHDDITFKVTIENISNDKEIVSPLSPGVWFVHNDNNILFQKGEKDKGLGLEKLAESGDIKDLLENTKGDNVLSKGSFDQPIKPGEKFTFEFTADPKTKLSFATMLVESNDLFLSFSGDGLELFDEDSEPVSGDFSRLVNVWDSGTEKNEKIGEGKNQAPRQETPESGEEGEGKVDFPSVNDDSVTYPSISNIIKLSIENNDSHDHGEEDHDEEGHSEEDHDHESESK